MCAKNAQWRLNVVDAGFALIAFIIIAITCYYLIKFVAIAILIQIITRILTINNKEGGPVVYQSLNGLPI